MVEDTTGRGGDPEKSGAPDAATPDAAAPDPDATAPDPAAPLPHLRHALGVETVIEPEHGRWAVDLVVVFPDGVVRHRIDTFPTQARAEISARLIKRAAERELRGPLHG